MDRTIDFTWLGRAYAGIERHRRAAAWTIAAALAMAALALRPVWPPSHPMTELLEESGVLLIAVAISGRVFCIMYIGGKKNRTLFRDGPYSVSRNPLYLCSVLGATGAGMTAASLTMGLLSGLLFWILFAAIVRAEERRLAQTFGDRYLEYRGQVPRWLPAFTLWRDPGALSPRGDRIVCTLRDSAALFLVIPVMEALEYAHTTGVLPALASVP